MFFPTWALPLLVAMRLASADAQSWGKRQVIYPPNTGINASSSPYTDAQNATAFALVYGFPLSAYADFAIPVLEIVGSNAFYNQNETSSSSSAAIVRPNADTLYSVAILDLSQSDLAVTVPNITDGRFWVCPFYDVYGDNFANVGSATNSPPGGTYLLRRAQDSGVSPGLQSTSVPAGYMGVVNFPTSYGFILNRILPRNNTSDLDVVHEYQAQLKITRASRAYTSTPLPPPLSIPLLGGGLNGSTEQQLLQLTARLAPYNPPEIPSQTQNVTSILALAGLSNGTYNAPASVNLTLAQQAATLSVRADLTDPSNILNFGNDWLQFILSISGDFHDDYAARAYIAQNAYAQLAPDEALYPEYTHGAIGTSLSDSPLFLAPGQALLFTFSGKPPVTGFWSLTAYNESGYLIENEENVYALGDRSNLTYPDGKPVYGPGSGTSSDGMFQILIQPADEAPPANWTDNWLPAPAGGGDFSLNLRWYGPTDAFTNGSYVYPLVTNQTALFANNNVVSGTQTRTQTGSQTSSNVGAPTGIQTSIPTGTQPNAPTVTQTIIQTITQTGTPNSAIIGFTTILSAPAIATLVCQLV